MKLKNDIKPIFNWAVENGEAKIVSRILMKLLPHIIKNELIITEEMVNSAKTLEVSDELYHLVKETAEEIVGNSYKA